MPRQPIGQRSNDGPTKPFAGFALPTSNTTYTPNQFFDVCLPHSSRGAVRLVAFLIRKTLGWCDRHGNPQAEQHLVSWADFERAGISRDMIKSSIDEAIDRHFIQCIEAPQTQKRGHRASAGLYELKWDEGAAYIKDPAEFRGFFGGQGNRTYIPNQFFDCLIPRETLAVVKMVGSVIRLSIGFQNKWGHRRQEVALSYDHIQSYARLKDRKTLSAAIRYAVQSNYIQRVEKGYFDPDGGKLSKAAVYAVKWLNPAAESLNSQKTPPAQIESDSWSENPTGNGQKSLLAQRSENPTDIEIKQSNETPKQQPAVAATLEMLRKAGFDAKAANVIASRFELERIERQLRWIDQRAVKSNRLGMLRVAIEQDWSAPAGRRIGNPTPFNRMTPPSRTERGASFTESVEAAHRRFLHPSSNPT